jgi:hypothetical protein
MLKKSILAATLLAAAVSAAHADTVIGGATLTDDAVVHAGTVTPTAYLTFLSGSNNVTGTADGTGYTIGAFTPGAAMATADHIWAQYDPAIFMTSGNTPLSSVLAIPAIDHGWAPGNTGEFWEPFEFKIWGCTAAALASCTEGHITAVYTLGVDDTGTGKNADDWATVWSFDTAYTIFAITSGDRLVRGPWSPGEGEIDALAVVAIPEPSELMLMLAGLGAVGAMARRRRRKA